LSSRDDPGDEGEGMSPDESGFGERRRNTAPAAGPEDVHG